MGQIGLFDMMDQAIAETLGVDVETYIKVIDGKCTDEEAKYIILTVLDEDEVEMERAKEMFNNYLNEL